MLAARLERHTYNIHTKTTYRQPAACYVNYSWLRLFGLQVKPENRCPTVAVADCENILIATSLHTLAGTLSLAGPWPADPICMTDSLQPKARRPLAACRSAAIL